MLATSKPLGNRIHQKDWLEHLSQDTGPVSESGSLRGQPVLEPHTGLDVQASFYSRPGLAAPVGETPPGPSALLTPSPPARSGERDAPWGGGGVLGLQSRFSASAEASVGADGPSLVEIRHNSVINANSDEAPELSVAERCPNATWIRGQCREHLQVRYVLKACKARDCEVCGPVTRWRIAERICYGVRQIENDGGYCAWLVLTFAEDVTKAAAVKKLAPFVRWLRKGNPGLKYVATYELTKQGRLHINLIAGPWKFIRQSKLQRRWGARLWVERVKHSGVMGTEAAKSYSPESLGGYVSKLEQAVPRVWHRRVSFSKDWPKMPEVTGGRVGVIDWREPTPEQRYMFEDMSDLGRVVEMRPGEYAFRFRLGDSLECRCFDLAEKRGDG